MQDLLRLHRSGPVVQQSLPEDSAVNFSTSPDDGQNGDVVDEDIVSIEQAETMVEVYKLGKRLMYEVRICDIFDFLQT